MTRLTHEDVGMLQDFLWANGLLDGRNAVAADALCRDLFGLVELIAREAAGKAVEELKAGAVLACYDALDAQQERIFEGLRRQLAWPQ